MIIYFYFYKYKININEEIIQFMLTDFTLIYLIILLASS